MRTLIAIITLSMVIPVVRGEDVNACLIEAIRRSANAPHVSTARCEAVMVEGMWISFTNANGAMTITAGKGFERSYTWEGDTRSLEMWPRSKRWYGSMGMYNPGSYIPGELEQWEPHDGIKRCVAAEGQRHFTDLTTALEWINTPYHRKRMDYIYNDSGLVVGMEKQPETLKERLSKDFPGTLSVDVWQIYIDGKKPDRMDGAKNDAISVYYPLTYDMNTVEVPAEPVNHNQ